MYQMICGSDVDLALEARLDQDTAAFKEYELDPICGDVYDHLSDVWDDGFMSPDQAMRLWYQDQVEEYRRQRRIELLLEMSEQPTEVEFVTVAADEWDTLNETVVMLERENVELRSENEASELRLESHRCPNCGWSKDS